MYTLNAFVFVVYEYVPSYYAYRYSKLYKTV